MSESQTDTPNLVNTLDAKRIEVDLYLLPDPFGNWRIVTEEDLDKIQEMMAGATSGVAPKHLRRWFMLEGAPSIASESILLSSQDHVCRVGQIATAASYLESVRLPRSQAHAFKEGDHWAIASDDAMAALGRSLEMCDKTEEEGMVAYAWSETLRACGLLGWTAEAQAEALEVGLRSSTPPASPEGTSSAVEGYPWTQPRVEP